MIKKIAIVSLSGGTIGEDFVNHEVDIGINRLNGFGVTVKFMPHACKGIEYVKNHPAERAADLLQALQDPDIDMILCAIGGDDTYRLLPYLFEHNELADAVSNKVFLGFSDTTINHFMFHKVGMKTFYGQSFLADVCELDKDRLCPCGRIPGVRQVDNPGDSGGNRSGCPITDQNSQNPRFFRGFRHAVSSYRRICRRSFPPQCIQLG